MRKVDRSALVPYSAQQMFGLVDDVESYSEFLPWCAESVVHSRSDDVVEATLELHKGAVSHRFTTRNSRNEFESIGLALVGGPFRHLAGGWYFRDLGTDGCKVSLQLEFELESMMLDMMFGSFFESTCNSLVDAFTKRAEVVIGSQ